MELMMVLPGARAGKFRGKCADYLCRLLSGDRSLIPAILAADANMPEAAKATIMQAVERPLVDGERANKRLKVCQTQKDLMDQVGSSNSGIPGVYGKVNGEINKAVTGRYAYELARELGKKKVNTRDHMTDFQLASAAFLEMAVANTIPSSNEDPVTVAKIMGEQLMRPVSHILHNQIETTPLQLRTARVACAAIEDKPPVDMRCQRRITDMFKIS